MREKVELLLRTLDTFSKDLVVEDTKVTTLCFNNEEGKLLNNYIQELQHQLEEKDKVIDEILDDGWFVEDCPMILNDFTKDDENNFNCENCEDDHKKCWLKYFENKVKRRGKNEKFIK